MDITKIDLRKREMYERYLSAFFDACQGHHAEYPAIDDAEKNLDLVAAASIGAIMGVMASKSSKPEEAIRSLMSMENVATMALKCLGKNRENVWHAKYPGTSNFALFVDGDPQQILDVEDIEKADAVIRVDGGEFEIVKDRGALKTPKLIHALFVEAIST